MVSNPVLIRCIFEEGDKRQEKKQNNNMQIDRQSWRERQREVERMKERERELQNCERYVLVKNIWILIDR